MPHRRWLSPRAPLATAVLAAVLAAVLTACGTAEDPNPTGSAGSLTSTTRSAVPATGAQPTGARTTPPQVTSAAATALCDAIRPELSNFRVQGPTLGRIGLNLIVHPWGVQNGIDVLGNKAVVDTVTAESCPDVRRQTLEALSTPDLATVIVGL
ncbi:hypothetical protein [Nocardia arizonensis]|uniref:hypothetical protein n=1 Tax=Nocardia arizonensis TaxID=1141647 RepID=UPI0006D0D685|nr:hypothetical protein [Nocardia arizonensis]